MESLLVSIGIILSYVMVAFAALTAVGFGVKKMMQNTNNAKKTIYMFGGLLLTSFIAYILASNTLLSSYEKYNIVPTTSKLVGMGIWGFYILLISSSLLIEVFRWTENWKRALLLLALQIIVGLFIWFFINVDIALIITYLMVALTVVIVLGFGVKQMMQNTNNAKKTIYTLGGLVIAFIIAYVLASDEVLKSWEKYEITAASSKQVGMGLITFYFLLFGAIGLVLYTELSKKILNNG